MFCTKHLVGATAVAATVLALPMILGGCQDTNDSDYEGRNWSTDNIYDNEPAPGGGINNSVAAPGHDATGMLNGSGDAGSQGPGPGSR